MKSHLFSILTIILLLSSMAYAQADPPRLISSSGDRPSAALINAGGCGFDPLEIFTDKSTYIHGETAQIGFGQLINSNCDELSSRYELLNPNGDQIATSTTNFGQAGYLCITTEYAQPINPPSAFPSGEYTVRERWFCSVGGTNYELGYDGEIGGTQQFNVLRFNVDAGSSTPHDPVCNRSCDPGYQLINPDSATCDCVPTWADNNGECELGEPESTNDCIAEEEECPDPQIRVDGQCVNPEDVYQKNDYTALLSLMMVLGGGLLGAVVGGASLGRLGLILGAVVGALLLMTLAAVVL